jgi:phage terminase large subunit
MADVKVELPNYARGLFTPKRYKVYWGGRGAARSWSYAQAILIMGAQRQLRVLCAREFQKSIADSVHKLFQDQIQRLGLSGWQITNKEITHKGTGTNIIFEGLRYNSNRIKSLEGIDICWVEEAESVTDQNWRILIPTIRKPSSEIWISFNPDLEDDPTYQRFVVEDPPNAIVQKVGWEDNPWFPDVLREEMEYLYRVDPEAADHVWGGEPRRSSEAQILHGKWKVEAFVPKKRWQGPFYGLDFGFAEDPTAGVECYIEPLPKSQGILYISNEMWKVRLDIDRTYREMVKSFGRHIGGRQVRADSARPETISYLKRHGLRNIRPVFKWPKSIEDGIAFLRQFEYIVIHPDCTQFRQEARLYSYKTDRLTGEVLAKVEDKHNHLIDALRYALAPQIRARKSPVSGYSGVSYNA